MLKYDEFLAHKSFFVFWLKFLTENINILNFQTKILNNSQNSPKNFLRRNKSLIFFLKERKKQILKQQASWNYYLWASLVVTAKSYVCLIIRAV